MIVFRLNNFCAVLSFWYSLLKCFGLAIFFPSLVVSKLEMPTSIPTFLSVGGNGFTFGSSTNKETNQRPLGSSLTVTVEGLQPSGKNLDQTQGYAPRASLDATACFAGCGNGFLHLASQRVLSSYLKADLVNSAEPPLRRALNRGYLARLPQKARKSFLQMSETLLQWYTTNFVEKVQIFSLFPTSKKTRSFFILNSFLSFIPSFSPSIQSFIVDQAYTTHCPSQEIFLFGSGKKSVSVSTFNARAKLESVARRDLQR